MFWSTNGRFSNFYFLGNIGHQNFFYDILHWKNAFVASENNKFKKWKNWHFSNGVSPWFRSKNGQFSNFFLLGNRCQENVFYDIQERKKAFLGYKNKNFKKSTNWNFPKRSNPWLWPKNGPFSNFFFRQYRPGKCLLWYSTSKKHICSLQKKEFKKSKNWHFCKGVNRWFWSKNGRFSNCYFLGNIGQENVFYEILEQKKRPY